MNPQETQYKFYKQSTGGEDYYQVVPWAGNVPYGMTPLSQQEYLSGKQQQLASNPTRWNPYYQSFADTEAKALSGAGTGLTMVNGVPTQVSSLKETAANEAAVAAGTMKKVPIGSGFGYIPTVSAAATNLPNIGTQNTANIANIPPKTTAEIKAFQAANGLVADGIIGPKTQAVLNVKFPQAPKTGAVGTNVPTGIKTGPILPGGSAVNTTQSYFNSLANSAAIAQQNLDNARNQQLQKIQQDKDRAQQELESIRSSQEGAINAQGNAALQEKQMILDRLSEQEARFNENYNIAQALTTRLTDLMTQGNETIAQVKGVTGLAGIRNPRITEATNAVTAAVGVVKAGLDAANGQMGQAQQQLQLATQTITAAFTDQIDYYKSLNNFYESMASDASAKTVQLTKDERTYLDSKIDDLTAQRDRIQQTSDLVQKAMMDPDTALAYATAGVTLNDTPEQISTKLASYGYSKELADTSKDMAEKGYTALVSGNAPAGSEVVSVTDSQGKVKTYYKKASRGGTGTISKPLGILDIQRYQELYPTAGITAGDTEAQANAKVQASNSPEGIIKSAKEGGATYDEVIQSLGNDQDSIDIANRLYGVSGTSGSTSTINKYAPVGESISAPTGNETTNEPGLINTLYNSLFK